MSRHHKSIAAFAMMAILTFGLTTCKKEKIDPPTVEVLDGVITIGITKASVSAEVTGQGGAEVKSRGFVYGLSGGSMDTVFCDGGTGVYSAELNNLLPNTTYVYEAFAQNIGGIGVSGKVAFTTNPLPSFTIDVSASPSDGGVVSGGGSFQEGQPCTIMAMANDGYTFTNWTENDIEVSSTMNYTFVVNSDRTLKANFTVQLLNEYTISVSANPNDGGIVSGGGTYHEGQSCTVSATANEGYTFANWTENGQLVSAGADYTFNVTGNRNLEARFTQNGYTINVLARPPQGGTVAGGGVFHYGEQTTLAATANSGYEFHGWDDGITTNPRIITVTGTATYTAVFGEIGATYYNVSATVDPEGAGSVNGTGPFPTGDTTILRVIPNPGYTFSQWQDGNTQNPRTVIVNSILSFTAYFTQNQYNIDTDVSPDGTGSVIGGGTYHYGDQPTLTATAYDGYIFDHWQDGSTLNPRQITVTNHATYTAYFTQAPPAQYTITTNVIPDGAGTVEGGGTYPEGATITLTAHESEGYDFDHWQDGSTQNPRQITVTGNATYTAHFTQTSSTQYTITISANPMEGGTVTGGGTYQQGDSCTVTATHADGYTFLRWTENGNEVSIDSSYTFTVTGHRILVAQFQMQTYTINVSVNPSDGGTVIGGGTYNYNQTCIVQASSNGGHYFSNWTENGQVVSTNSYYSFNVNGNRDLVANFPTRTCQIILESHPSNGGTVTGEGSYVCGQLCTVTAIAATGYTFLCWTHGNNTVSTDASYSFIVPNNSDYYLYAHFIIQAQTPIGAINGVFSISGEEQVWFSSGNLQYKVSDDEWQFAPNQYDIIGVSNNNISQNYNGWLDLFGWGTSGWNNGNMCYLPWESNTQSDYYGPPNGYCLTGAYANSDWGVYNGISNGGNIPNYWRTLTAGEWKYLFDHRGTHSGNRYVKAVVNEIKGVILLPDDWNSLYILNNTNSWNSNYNDNIISESVWINTFELNGAVFLPAGGYRNGATTSMEGSEGYYWSSGSYALSHAYTIWFSNSNGSCIDYKPRARGYSIRLVRVIQ